MSVSKTILIGNLGGDPEVRFMPNGNAVCKNIADYIEGNLGQWTSVSVSYEDIKERVK